MQSSTAPTKNKRSKRKMKYTEYVQFARDKKLKKKLRLASLRKQREFLEDELQL